MTPRRPDQPRPGFFKMRIVKGGAYVGAEIRHGPSRDPDTGGLMDERSWMWETWINGELARAPSPDPTHAGVWRVWMHAEEISEPAYRHLIADREWCKQNLPASPEAQPTKKADPHNPEIGSLLP